MKRILASALSGLIAWSSLGTSRAMAQEPGPSAVGSYVQQGPGQVFLGNRLPPVGPVPFSPLLYLDQSMGQAPGYNAYFTRVNAFVPWQIVPGETMAFGSVNLVATDNRGNFVGNFGGGLRQYVADWDRIFGVNGWYDYDGGHIGNYNRVGAGFETLGRFFDARVNTYFIIGSGSTVLSQQLFGNPFFMGQNIALMQNRRAEVAYNVVDGEVGGLLPLFGRYGVYGYVGGYYFNPQDSDGDSTTGVSLHLQSIITDDITLDTKYNYDQLFGSNLWFNVALALPDGRPAYWFQPKTVRERMTQQVDRRIRIPVAYTSRDHVSLLNNPATNRPYTILHVDPAAVGGDGSIEHPFGTMDQARSANSPNIDIIYVRPNADGSGTDLAMAAPLTLFDHERLLSTSVAQFINTPNGPLQLQGFTGGPNPILTNSSTTPSSVVILTNDNEISGFTIDGSSIHAGVTGTNVTAFNINNSVIANAADAIRFVTNGGGTTSGILTQSTLLNNTGAGMNLITNGGTVQVQLTGNQITGNVGSGVISTANNATVRLDVLNNSITNNGGYGVGSVATSSNTTLNIQSNSFSGNGLGNIASLNAAGTTTLAVTGNQVLNSRGPGAALVPGILAQTTAGGTTTGTISGNNISSNAGSGIAVVADSGQTTLTIGGPTPADANTINGNGEMGIRVDLSGTALATLLMQNNTITGTTGTATTQASLDGIRFNLSGQSILRGTTIADSLITQNPANGVNLQISDQARVENLTLSNDQILQNGGNGFLAALTGNGTIQGMNLTGSTLSNNTLDGIHLQLADSSLISGATIAGNTLDANQANNVSVIAQDVARVDNFLLQGNTITNAGQNGILFRSSDAANIFRPAIVGNNITSNAGDGLRVEMLGSVPIDPILQNNQITLNRGNGITFLAGDSIILRPFIAGSTISGNIGNGIALVAVNNMTLIPTIVNNTFTNNGTTTGGAGLLLQGQNQSTVSGLIQGNTFSGNGIGLKLDRRDDSRFTGIVIGTAPDGTGQGNAFRGNTVAGVQIAGTSDDRDRDPQAVGPDIVNTVWIGGNTFDQNADGLFVNLVGDTIFLVNTVQNSFTNNTANGIRVLTQSNSSFGNPLDGTASFMDGNTFVNNGQNAIFLRSEGDSYQNVAITGTTQRTSITGGTDGIHIEQLSTPTAGLVGGMPGRELENRFTIAATDISNVSRDGIALITGRGPNTDYEVANRATFVIGAQDRTNYVTVTGSGDDGLEATFDGIALYDERTRSNTGTSNIPYTDVNGTPGDPGDDVINRYNPPPGTSRDSLQLDRFSLFVLGDATAPEGQRTLFSGNGRLTGSGDTDPTRGDGITIRHQIDDSPNSADDPIFQGPNLDVHILGVSALSNAGRGLTVDDRSEYGIGVYQIGALGAQNVNTFNSNRLQGVVLQTVAKGFQAPFVPRTPNLPNAVIPADEPDDAQRLTGFDDPNPPTDNYVDLTSRVRVQAYFTFENNTVRFNGQSVPGEAAGIPLADGLALLVGTNTLMHADVNGNLFGGNGLDDVLVTPIVSVEPTPSIDGTGNDNDQLQYDPVAYMDLAFGVFDTNSPDHTNPAAAITPNAGRGNVGNDIRLPYGFVLYGQADGYADTTRGPVWVPRETDFGTRLPAIELAAGRQQYVIAGTTLTDYYRQADVFKQNGATISNVNPQVFNTPGAPSNGSPITQIQNRPVFGVFQVYTSGLLDNPAVGTGNQFIQQGIPQNITQTFDNAGFFFAPPGTVFPIQPGQQIPTIPVYPTFVAGPGDVNVPAIFDSPQVPVVPFLPPIVHTRTFPTH